MTHKQARFIALISIICFLAGFGIIANGRAAAALTLDRQVSQQPNASPDLTIERIILQPDNPGAGSVADITPVIKNSGDAVAPGFSIHLYVVPAENPPTPATPFTAKTFFGLGLAVGATFDGWTRTGQPFATATWTVCAWVDRDNQVQEADETNNVLCVASPQQPPGNPDAFEADDTCQQAKEVAANAAAQDRNLFRANNADDVDWIKLTGQSGVKYVADAIATGADADLSLELYSRCDGAPSFGSGARVSFTAPTDGSYYLKVSHNQPNYGPNNAYQLKVSAESGCQALLEPNNLCALPVDLSTSAGSQTQSFCTENDVDWMRLEVKAGGNYKITAQNVGSNANVQLSFFDSCQATGTPAGQQVEFTAPAAGFVYFKAQNLDPKVYGAGTDYTIEATGSGGCEEDRLEQDDAQTSAQPLNIDSNTQVHTICPAGDEDWVKFTASAGITYTIETVDLADHADPVLCLYDAAGAELRCDDDSGAGRGARLVIENALAGDYTFKIKDNDPAVAGERTQYAVQVLTAKCKPDKLEPDNTLANAQPIATDGSAQEHNICAADDVDWTAFNADANTSYVIETVATGSEADTEIELYDAAGNRLARNDDYTPGISSRISYPISSAGVYYIKTQLFNRERFGAGTEYQLLVRSGNAPTPTPTPPSVPPSATPTPTPPPTGVRTLILVNAARIGQLYSDADATRLLNKLEELARHAEVRGEIIRLEQNSEVAAAYAAWTADLTNVDQANRVTDSIRRVVVNYLLERNGVEYVVLVGDDRALPLRRVPDNTPRQSENTYNEVDASHPVGAALRANYFLTDDFYGDREPTPHQGREIYLPDLAVGRLIEAPDDMIGVIDAFLASPTTPVEQMLVTGYDFVQDTAAAECKDWQQVLPGNNVACLIGSTWTREQFSELQLRTNTPFKVQSINGHAAHFAEGAAASGSIQAEQIAATAMDLSGGLIYTLGCHGGLNVPPGNSVSPTDLPEVFARKRANYIGNTGYGWGLLSSMGLSEKVIRLFTRELLKAEQVAMGKALVSAKNAYYQQDQNFSAFDEKVMQQLVFYGLPMAQVRSNGTLSLGDEFPGVGFEFDPTGSLSGAEVITKSVKVDFQRILDPDSDIGKLDTFATESGTYYALYGTTNADAGEPVQPLHFGSIAVPNTSARAAVLLGGSFTTQANFDPLIGTPINEYVSRAADAELSPAELVGWYPPLPIGVRTHDSDSTLITQLGQFNSTSSELRLYRDLNVEVYYSTSTDQTAPEIQVVDGLYDPTSNLIQVKVGVTDASGIKAVFVSFIEDSRQSTASLQSLKLTFDAAAQKWLGSFGGDDNSVFFVQAVDNAGNVISATNKGLYYRPATARTGAGTLIYLPVVVR